MNETDLDNEFDGLMNDVAQDLQTISEGGTLTTLQGDVTSMKFGTDLAIDMAKKSSRIAEILRYFEKSDEM